MSVREGESESSEMRARVRLGKEGERLRGRVGREGDDGRIGILK